MPGAGVSLVIGDMVNRLAIESRRAEIVVTNFVGGTDFLCESAISIPRFVGTELEGGLLAVLLINVVMFGLKGPISSVPGVYGGNPFSLTGYWPSATVFSFL